MKKWKQRIALFLSVILSITSVFTWNSTIRVHAEEAVIKSSADGFEYRYQSDTHEYLCTSDKTQVYDDYKDAIKGLADISRKILVERKVEPFIVKIPVEIKADQKVAEEAKKSEAEAVVKKLLAGGMSADEILEKLK